MNKAIRSANLYRVSTKKQLYSTKNDNDYEENDIPMQ